MPKKENSRKVETLVTLFVGLLMATITVVVSNLSDTHKAIMALSLVLIGYIAYNEITKHYRSKSREV